MRSRLLFTVLTIISLLLGFQADAGIIMRGSGGYLCDGTPDWGGGGVLESFDNSSGDGNFCSADWTVDDDAGVINTYDATQYKHLTHSASITYDADTATSEWIRATLNASVENPNIQYFGGWYYVPDVPTTAEMGYLIDIQEDTTNRVVNVTLDDDGGVDKLCLTIGVDCDADYFDVSAHGWFFISLAIAVDDVCYMRVYNSGGTQIDCVGATCASMTLPYTSNNNDIDWIQFNDRNSSSTAVTGYIDSWRTSSSGWITP